LLEAEVVEVHSAARRGRGAILIGGNSPGRALEYKREEQEEQRDRHFAALIAKV
jgi:hypothetical protein